MRVCVQSTCQRLGKGCACVCVCVYNRSVSWIVFNDRCTGTTPLITCSNSVHAHTQTHNDASHTLTRIHWHMNTRKARACVNPYTPLKTHHTHTHTHTHPPMHTRTHIYVNTSVQAYLNCTWHTCAQEMCVKPHASLKTQSIHIPGNNWNMQCVCVASSDTSVPNDRRPIADTTRQWTSRVRTRSTHGFTASAHLQSIRPGACAMCVNVTVYMYIYHDVCTHMQPTRYSTYTYVIIRAYTAYIRVYSTRAWLCMANAYQRTIWPTFPTNTN
jgi:hypothetical protein